MTWRPAYWHDVDNLSALERAAYRAAMSLAIVLFGCVLVAVAIASAAGLA